jgi:hypothetical protein
MLGLTKNVNEHDKLGFNVILDVETLIKNM